MSSSTAVVTQQVKLGYQRKIALITFFAGLLFCTIGIFLMIEGFSSMVSSLSSSPSGTEIHMSSNWHNPNQSWLPIDGGRHLDLVITGQIDTGVTGVWTVLYGLRGEKAILSYVPRNSFYPDIVLHGDWVKNIRGNSIRLLSGEKYILELYRMPYTEELPKELTGLISTTSVVIPAS